MNGLPIVHRELRVTARRASTYYYRSLAAAVAMFICFAMLLAGFGGALSTASAGRGLFLILSGVGYLYVLLQGALSTADCLSREKREGTIGLLFLTELKGFDVVLGKIMAQPWNGLYVLLATFPIPSFAFVLGGITWGDLLLLLPALANTLFFSAAAGMLVSAAAYHERTALSGALGLVLFFGGVLPALGYWRMNVLGAATIPPGLLVLGPAGTVLSVIRPALVGAPYWVYGCSFLVTLGLGLTCFFGAAALLPHAWQQKTETDGIACSHRRSAKRPARVPAAATGPPPDLWQEVNPVFRLGLLLERRNPHLRRVLSGLAGTWLIALLLFPRAVTRPEFFVGLAVLLHYIVRFSLAMQACRAFGEERRSGMLELLLTTPLGEDEILRGRLVALKRQYVRPLLFIVGWDAALLLTGLPSQAPGAQTAFLGGFVAALVMLLADLYTLAWVGLWFGLKVNSPSRAIRQTVFVVLVVPWLLWLGSMALIGLLTGGRIGPELFVLGLVWAFLLFGVNAVGMVGWATNRLRDDFRPAATDTFAGSPFQRTGNSSS